MFRSKGLCVFEDYVVPRKLPQVLAMVSPHCQRVSVCHDPFFSDHLKEKDFTPLNRIGISHRLHSMCDPNNFKSPDLCTDLTRNDCIIAIGGGTLQNYVKQNMMNQQSKARLIIVPSTIGSLSECNNDTRNTDDSTNPSLSSDNDYHSPSDDHLTLVDSTLLKTLPRKQVAHGCYSLIGTSLDILCCEPGNCANPIIDSLIRSALRSVFEYSARATYKIGKGDSIARSQVSHASVMVSMSKHNTVNPSPPLQLLSLSLEKHFKVPYSIASASVTPALFKALVRCQMERRNPLGECTASHNFREMLGRLVHDCQLRHTAVYHLLCKERGQHNIELLDNSSLFFAILDRLRSEIDITPFPKIIDDYNITTSQMTELCQSLSQELSDEDGTNANGDPPSSSKLFDFWMELMDDLRRDDFPYIQNVCMHKC